MMMTQLADPAPRQPRKRPKRAPRGHTTSQPATRPTGSPIRRRGPFSWFPRGVGLGRLKWTARHRPEAVTATELELAKAR